MNPISADRKKLATQLLKSFQTILSFDRKFEKQGASYHERETTFIYYLKCLAYLSPHSYFLSDKVRNELNQQDAIQIAKTFVTISNLPTLFTINERSYAIKSFAILVSRLPQDLNRKDKELKTSIDFIRKRAETGTGPVNAQCLYAISILSLNRPDLLIDAQKRIFELLCQFDKLDINMQIMTFKSVYRLPQTTIEIQNSIKELLKLIETRKEILYTTAIRAYVHSLMVNKKPKLSAIEKLITRLTETHANLTLISAQSNIFKTLGEIVMEIPETSETILKFLSENLSNVTAYQQIAKYAIKANDAETVQTFFDMGYSHILSSTEQKPCPAVLKTLCNIALAFPQFWQPFNEQIAQIISKLMFCPPIIYPYFLFESPAAVEPYQVPQNRTKDLWANLPQTEIKFSPDCDFVYTIRDGISKLSLLQKLIPQDLISPFQELNQLYLYDNVLVYADQVATFLALITYHEEPQNLIPLLRMVIDNKKYDSDRKKCKGSDIIELMHGNANFTYITLLCSLIRLPEFLNHDYMISIFEDVASIRDAFSVLKIRLY